jgi:hypothetical protein
MFAFRRASRGQLREFEFLAAKQASYYRLLLFNLSVFIPCFSFETAEKAWLIIISHLPSYLGIKNSSLMNFERVDCRKNCFIGEIYFVISSSHFNSHKTVESG